MERPAEARHYVRLDENSVRCGLCPHNCKIADGKAGICGVRKNDKGVLYSEIYGRLTAQSMDPIEKKPLYHFYPGSSILSIGTKGCNFKCPYCQNWHISQDLAVQTEYRSPEEVVRMALANRSIGIAYTYSEPMIWFEFVMDTAKIARKEGLFNVMVTNGFVNTQPLEELLQFVDAMNIDLKAFREQTYSKIQKGRLQEVKNTIGICHARGCHIEITTLVVTGINDNMEELMEIADFISGIDRGIPWHVSRYHPSYRYDKPATDMELMMRACEEGRKKLDYVYCGNVSPQYGGNDTICPSCGTAIIRRSGYRVMPVLIENGACGKCGASIGIRM